MNTDGIVGGELPILALAEREVAAETRKGWRRDLKEVERRWRRWQG